MQEEPNVMLAPLADSAMTKWVCRHAASVRRGILLTQLVPLPAKPVRPTTIHEKNRQAALSVRMANSMSLRMTILCTKPGGVENDVLIIRFVVWASNSLATPQTVPDNAQTVMKINISQNQINGMHHVCPVESAHWATSATDVTLVRPGPANRARSARSRMTRLIRLAKFVQLAHLRLLPKQQSAFLVLLDISRTKEQVHAMHALQVLPTRRIRTHVCNALLVSTVEWDLQFAALVLMVITLMLAIRHARRVGLVPLDKAQLRIPTIA
jgi:hypothetical protein